MKNPLTAGIKPGRKLALSIAAIFIAHAFGATAAAADANPRAEESVIRRLNDLEASLSTLSRQVGQLTQADDSIGNLAASLQSLQLEVASLKQRISALESRAGTVIWSGGTNVVAYGNYWTTLPADRVDFNNAPNHLSVATTGIVTVKVAGYYRVNFWALTQTGTGEGIVHVVKNDQVIHEGRVYSVNGSWVEHRADLMWHFNANDTITVRLYAVRGGYPYLVPNNRLQIQFVGP